MGEWGRGGQSRNRETILGENVLTFFRARRGTAFERRRRLERARPSPSRPRDAPLFAGWSTRSRADAPGTNVFPVPTRRKKVAC